MSFEKKKRVALEFFEDQSIFFNNCLTGEYSYLVFAGSINSGKSVSQIGALILLSKMYPGSRWFVVRKDLPTLKLTSIPTFLKIVPKSFIDTWNKSESVCTFTNGSSIKFMAESVKEDPELNRFKGLEPSGFVLEQIEELSEELFTVCKSRLGRWKINPMPPSIIMMNCNPNSYWPKAMFYDAWKADTLKAPYYFQPADVFRNPHLTEEERAHYNELPDEFKRKFINNEWEGINAIHQLVEWEYLEQAKNLVSSPENAPLTAYMGVDVGRFGPDPSVWTIIINNNIKRIYTKAHTDLVEVQELTKKYMLEYNIPAEHVAIDSVGIGSGVVDNLRASGRNVIAFSGGETAESKRAIFEFFKFKNHRSLAGWIAREEIRQGRIGGLTKNKLQADISNIWYYIKGDKEIYIESKDDFRARTKRSSDHWDSFYMAIWAKYYNLIDPAPSITFGSEVETRDKIKEAKTVLDTQEITTLEELGVF